MFLHFLLLPLVEHGQEFLAFPVSGFLAGKAIKCRPIFSVARKATLLWPGLPQNPGLDQAYQAFPGHAFLASPAKTLASLAWPGLAGLAMLLTALLMQGMIQPNNTGMTLCKRFDSSREMKTHYLFWL